MLPGHIYIYQFRALTVTFQRLLHYNIVLLEQIKQLLLIKELPERGIRQKGFRKSGDKYKEQQSRHQKQFVMDEWIKYSTSTRKTGVRLPHEA